MSNFSTIIFGTAMFEVDDLSQYVKPCHCGIGMPPFILDLPIAGNMFTVQALRSVGAPSAGYVEELLGDASQITFAHYRTCFFGGVYIYIYIHMIYHI